MDGEPPYEIKNDRRASGILTWLQILTIIAGSNIGAIYVGKYWERNEGLPTKLEQFQDKYSEALQTQAKINTELLQQLSDIRADVKVGATNLANQDKRLERLEKLVDDFRKQTK